GEDKVFDFSLGNPSITPPSEVKEAIIKVLNEENENYVHGYMNNSGYDDVRGKIAESLNKRFGTEFGPHNILMTVGAAGGLNVIFKTLLNPEDEVITFAPYFGEYRAYTANYDGKLVVVSPNTETFQPNLTEFAAKITPKTKAVIINSPNNPTGVVYSEETIMALSAILLEKQDEFGTDIYLISDEPYRELVYDGVEVPYLPNYYDNTIVGYSFSKSLSLPGERIGYLVLPDTLSDAQNIIAAANVANRILGFVNAPSLFQRVVSRCLDVDIAPNIAKYNANRELLYTNLLSYGYECIKPEGAFYLFVKSPIADDIAFCQMAKKYNLLIVPGTSFGCPGFVRIAYCVSHDTAKNALPAFKKVMEEVKAL
ncbi:MAG: pyridoxal phosphate-dependent aminotransferase, partial [Selenomonadales bacterium]|nr:pyridoxal phosphate-dependent aminotransferase [Selenomonadales bacterium]